MSALNRFLYPRRVKSDGRVLADGTAYDVKQALAGQQIVLHILAVCSFKLDLQSLVPRSRLHHLLNDTGCLVQPPLQ